MVRGMARSVKPAAAFRLAKVCQNVLDKPVRGLKIWSFFFRGRPPDVADEAGMGGAAQFIILTGLTQAQVAIHGGVDRGGVVGILAVILPPADWAEFHGVGG